MHLGEVVENSFGDVFFSDINGDSFAQQSAHTLFEKYIFPHLETENCVYLIVGTDSGLLANAIEHRFRGNLGQRQFVFIEHTDVLACFGQLNFPSWLQIIGSDQNSVNFLLENHLDAVSEDKIVLVQSIALVEGHADYVSLKKSLTEELMAYQHERGCLIYAHNFNKATLYNLAHNILPLQDYERALTGMQAVVVGAGPSLDSAIEWIQKNQNSLLVFAAARVAKRLEDAGIKVHFFISIDPSLDSFFNSRDMLKVDYPCILINRTYVHPSLLAQWRGSHLYFDELYPWLAQDHNNIMSVGNTVTHSAVGAAVLLGASSVYLAGVDMCYKGSQTHAEGSGENEIGKYFVSVRPQVITYRGDMADTSTAFSEGRSQLAHQVAFCQQNMGNSVKFYNLSPDAAFVDGIALWDTDQQIQDGGSGFLERYHALLQTTTTTLTQEKKHIIQVLKSVQAKRLMFSKAQKLAQDGLKLARSISDGYFSEQDKLHKVEKKLTQLIEQDQSFFSAIGFLFFERLTVVELSLKRKHGTLQGLSASDLRLFYITKFDAFLHTISKVIELFDDALLRVQLYKQFLDGSRSLDVLAKAWLADGVPGMVYHWQSLFPEQAALEKNQATMSDLKTADRFLLEEAQGSQMEGLRAQAVDISYLLNEVSRALLLSDHVELHGLEQAFVKAVVSESDQSAVKTLFKGLLFILNNDRIYALSCFSTLNFEEPLLQAFMLKEKLKLALSLNEHDAIVAAYEALSVLSQEFLPAFANYWLVMKQPQQALPLLQAYLQQQPEDLEAQLRLLRVWIALSDVGQASALLQRLKNTHPHNSELTKIEQGLMNEECQNG